MFLLVRHPSKDGCFLFEKLTGKVVLAYRMLSLLFHIGRYFMMLGAIFRSMDKARVYYQLWISESVQMIQGSLFIVLVISSFMGATTTLQTVYQPIMNSVPQAMVGSLVSATTLLSLSPSILSFILAGHIGSRIASEIGNKRTTDQIDALEAKGVNPQAYLILPIILAGVVTFPILVTISAFFSHLGGMLVGELTGKTTFIQFTQGLQEYFEPIQVAVMYVKSITFGFIVTTISAYQGFFIQGEALEVGKSSRNAVVYSCLTIVLADYFIAQIML